VNDFLSFCRVNLADLFEQRPTVGKCQRRFPGVDFFFCGNIFLGKKLLRSGACRSSWTMVQPVYPPCHGLPFFRNVFLQSVCEPNRFTAARGAPILTPPRGVSSTLRFLWLEPERESGFGGEVLIGRCFFISS